MNDQRFDAWRASIKRLTFAFVYSVEAFSCPSVTITTMQRSGFSAFQSWSSWVIVIPTASRSGVQPRGSYSAFVSGFTSAIGCIARKRSVASLSKRTNAQNTRQPSVVQSDALSFGLDSIAASSARRDSINSARNSSGCMMTLQLRALHALSPGVFLTVHGDLPVHGFVAHILRPGFFVSHEHRGLFRSEERRVGKELGWRGEGE